jgi:hypothetical protein
MLADYLLVALLGFFLTETIGGVKSNDLGRIPT